MKSIGHPQRLRPGRGARSLIYVKLKEKKVRKIEKKKERKKERKEKKVEGRIEGKKERSLLLDIMV